MKVTIEDLAKDAGYKHPDANGECEDYAYFDHKKFAQLIINECIEKCEEVVDGRRCRSAEDCVEELKEYFGVIDR